MKFFKDKKFKNNLWFTFVELVISLFVSSIILWGVFYFIADNVDEISLATKKTSFFNSFYNFRDKIIYNTNLYSSGIIIVDSDISMWNDVLLLQNLDWSDWIVIWVVNNNSKKLEKTLEYYNTYYDKRLWFKRVSETEISSIKSNSGAVYDILFYNDNIYELFTKEFQVEYYNTWSILDINTSFITNFDDIYVWNNWDDIHDIDIFKTNLNF